VQFALDFTLEHSLLALHSLMLTLVLIHALLQGGNDYEIFTSEKTIGHTVTSPDDTRKQCTELFLS
jgi:hypothetical protein